MNNIKSYTETSPYIVKFLIIELSIDIETFFR